MVFCFRSVFSNITELLLLQIPAAIFALGNLCMEKILPETLVISGSNWMGNACLIIVHTILITNTNGGPQDSNTHHIFGSWDLTKKHVLKVFQYGRRNPEVSVRKKQKSQRYNIFITDGDKRFIRQCLVPANCVKRNWNSETNPRLAKC